MEGSCSPGQEVPIAPCAIERNLASPPLRHASLRFLRNALFVRVGAENIAVLPRNCSFTFQFYRTTRISVA